MKPEFKTLACSTALATCMALPVAAQSEDGTDKAAQKLNIEVTTLIDHRIYMPMAENGERDAMAQQLPDSVNDAPDSWEMVGEVDDLLVARDGRINAMIVDAGGYLGMDKSEVQVPVANLSFVRDGDDEGEYFVVFTGSQSEFEEQGMYDDARAQSEGMQRASTGGFLDGRESSMEDVQLADVTTEELLGATAYGSNDNWVGEVSELSLAEDGKVDAFIVDVGGFLGIGEKAVVLTPDQVDLVRVYGDELRAQISVSESKLEDMDAWDGNKS